MTRDKKNSNPNKNLNLFFNEKLNICNEKQHNKTIKIIFNTIEITRLGLYFDSSIKIFDTS
jgi:hypothetical protein